VTDTAERLMVEFEARPSLSGPTTDPGSDAAGVLAQRQYLRRLCGRLKKRDPPATERVSARQSTNQLFGDARHRQPAATDSSQAASGSR